MTRSYIKKIYKSITHILLTGFRSNNKKKESYTSLEKANDFIRNMNRYEKLLTHQHLMDEADLFRQASRLAKPKNGAVIILQSNLSMTQLSHDFLQNLLPKKIFKLPLPYVYGDRKSTRLNSSHVAI